MNSADVTTPITYWPPVQKPSRMPAHRYQPFHEQIAVDLPDRT